MSNNLIRDIERFLRKNILQARNEAITKIVLRHAMPGTKGSDVESFSVPDDPDHLSETANEIISRAEEDANGMGGIQRYVLNLYESTNPKSAARFPFRIRGQDEEFDDGGAGGEEAPTSKGLLQQLMRHNEANSRTMTVAIGGIVNALVRRLDASDARVEKLMEQRYQMYETLEASMSQQHMRDMEMLQQDASEKRKEQVFGKLMLLLPAVLNKLSGKKVMDGDDPMTLMVRGFAESLTPDQIRSLAEKLTQEQQIVLAQLLQSAKPKQLEQSKT